jgi:hypothetical protein
MAFDVGGLVDVPVVVAHVARVDPAHGHDLAGPEDLALRGHAVATTPDLVAASLRSPPAPGGVSAVRCLSFMIDRMSALLTWIPQYQAWREQVAEPRRFVCKPASPTAVPAAYLRFPFRQDPTNDPSWGACEMPAPQLAKYGPGPRQAAVASAFPRCGPLSPAAVGWGAAAAAATTRSPAAVVPRSTEAEQARRQPRPWRLPRRRRRFRPSPLSLNGRLPSSASSEGRIVHPSRCGVTDDHRPTARPRWLTRGCPRGFDSSRDRAVPLPDGASLTG